jgi:myotubularin-related protein 14
MQAKKAGGFTITSSEKAIPERLNGISINSIPYPGCEFFRPFKEQGRSAIGLLYNWNLDFVDTKLTLPNLSEIQERVEINWGDYKSWDLVELTNNYLVYIFASLSKGSESSALIHCNSGWDRTPLFISLVRTCLWADGLAHQSLSEMEFLYLMLAYDWMLFSHQLKNRADKGEEGNSLLLLLLFTVCR